MENHSSTGLLLGPALLFWPKRLSVRGAVQNGLPLFWSRFQNPLVEPGTQMQVCTWEWEPSQGRGRSVAEQGTGAA